MKVLFGTVVCNVHARNIALALHEKGALGAYHTGAVDHYRNPAAKALRGAVERCFPAADRLLKRRRIREIPENLIHAHWGWDVARTLTAPRNVLLGDSIWEKAEHALDARCAALMKTKAFDAFIGVEHGCLETLRACKAVGKRCAVVFMSPHHSFYEKYVLPEYEKYEPDSSTRKEILKRSPSRDRRRDEEAAAADAIHCNSELTKRTLISAGFSADKIFAVPLASASPPENRPADSPAGPVRFVYTGNLSIAKGTHYLLEAWKRSGVGVSAKAELHLFGANWMEPRFSAPLEGVFRHGHVSKDELMAAYRSASVFVFPTLFDGFGMAPLEAMGHGLPVVTTTNAGIVSIVQSGINGFVVPPADPVSLADRIRWCVGHPAELQPMRAAALETARKRVWRNFREEFVWNLDEYGFSIG